MNIVNIINERIDKINETNRKYGWEEQAIDKIEIDMDDELLPMVTIIPTKNNSRMSATFQHIIIELSDKDIEMIKENFEKVEVRE